MRLILLGPPGAGKGTGEDLVPRDDDTEGTVRRRLAVYRAQTQPLLAYYAAWEASGDPHAPRVRRVNGLGGVDEVAALALAAVANR